MMMSPSCRQQFRWSEISAVHPSGLDLHPALVHEGQVAAAKVSIVTGNGLNGENDKSSGIVYHSSMWAVLLILYFAFLSEMGSAA